jgi:DNA gyrase subunit A
MGRATQGVKIIRLRDEDKIASVAKVSKFEEEQVTLLDEDGNIIENPEVIKGEEADSSDSTNEDNLNEN